MPNCDKYQLCACPKRYTVLTCRLIGILLSAIARQLRKEIRIVTRKETKHPDRLATFEQEMKLLEVMRDPAGWLRSLSPSDRRSVRSFVFGKSRVIPKCLAQLVGQDHQDTGRIAAPVSLYQSVFIGA